MSSTDESAYSSPKGLTLQEAQEIVPRARVKRLTERWESGMETTRREAPTTDAEPAKAEDELKLAMPGTLHTKVDLTEPPNKGRPVRLDVMEVGAVQVPITGRRTQTFPPGSR